MTCPLPSTITFLINFPLPFLASYISLSLSWTKKTKNCSFSSFFSENYTTYCNLVVFGLVGFLILRVLSQQLSSKELLKSKRQVFFNKNSFFVGFSIIKNPILSVFAVFVVLYCAQHSLYSSCLCYFYL